MTLAAMYMNRREQDDNADNADDKNYAAEDKHGVDDDKYDSEHNCDQGIC